MTVTNKMELKTQQILSMQQLQSLNILTCNNQELAEVLNQEFIENPMLEFDGNKTEDIISSLDKIYESSNINQQKESYENIDDEEKKGSEIVDIKSNNNLEDLLLSQLDSKKYTKEQWELFRILVQCLDDDGFLKIDPLSLSEVFPYSKEEIKNSLEILKGLEPVGIFSKDLAECILKQIQQKGIKDPILFRLVSENLAEIIAGNLALVTRKYKLKTEELKKYIHLIGTFNPRPIINAEKDDTQFIIPDIIVHQIKEGYRIQINDNWIGNFKINDYYLKLLRTTQDAELREYFEKKLLRARNILSAVEQRRKTIIKIMDCILEIQHDYFEGIGPLKPMKMGDIANQIGVNISTVSRAIKDKYVQYHRTDSLHSLFTSAHINGDYHSEYSNSELLSEIKTIIGNENKTSPLSDKEICSLLNKKGALISRRTIAKYRKEACIPDSRQRVYIKSE